MNDCFFNSIGVLKDFLSSLPYNLICSLSLIVNDTPAFSFSLQATRSITRKTFTIITEVLMKMFAPRNVIPKSDSIYQSTSVQILIHKEAKLNNLKTNVPEALWLITIISLFSFFSFFLTF